MNYNCLKARSIKNQLGIYKKGLQSAHIKKKKNSDPSIPLMESYSITKLKFHFEIILDFWDM